MVWCRAVVRATEEAISASKGNEGFVAFCSWPLEREGQEEVLILQLQKDVWDAHYHLTKRVRKGSSPVSQPATRSLIDAVVLLFLAGCREAMTADQPGLGLRNVSGLEQIPSAGGQDLMRTVAKAASRWFGGSSLYETCCTLATLRYEGKEGVGRMVFAPKEHPSVTATITLAQPVPLSSPAAVRKLLQMARGQLALLSDSVNVHGLGGVSDKYDPASEDVFTVEFTRQGDWGLSHAGRRLMHVHFGQASLGPEGFPAERFRADLPRVVTSLTPGELDHLFELARTFAEQPHGCLLVISTNAATEAERLDTQCTRVAPFPLTASVIPLVTAIDGAVLIDPTGVCHAIGVILDGEASPKCSPERGARYNSAVRYTEWKKNTVAVIKSEDGMVSVFPSLRPQIRRTEIAGRLATLRGIAARDQVEPSDMSEVNEWLEAHAFYLTQSECDEVNRLRAVVDQKAPPSSIRIERDPINPHPDMNQSYYLPEPRG